MYVHMYVPFFRQYIRILHVYIHTYIHTYMPYIHTCHAYIHTCHACIHTHKHRYCVCVFMFHIIRRHSWTLILPHTYIRTYIHTFMHTYIDTVFVCSCLIISHKSFEDTAEHSYFHIHTYMSCMHACIYTNIDTVFVCWCFTHYSKTQLNTHTSTYIIHEVTCAIISAHATAVGTRSVDLCITLCFMCVMMSARCFPLTCTENKNVARAEGDHGYDNLVHVCHTFTVCGVEKHTQRTRQAFLFTNSREIMIETC